ncbi:MAG TPA: [FeFe] hydrogenase H-cluster radical SAM maturase HydG, partial [Myxococcota bacterium]|nr:[FeFe] hydrogenase H-cluster radical SAM maturase HydG [Myxococcota bacterium]
MIRPDSTGLTSFIPQDYIEELLARPQASAEEVRRILARSMDKKRLELEEMAALLSVTDPTLLEEMFQAARTLKKTVYGNRIVLFAPLYVGNKCVNSCLYCGFRAANKEVVRRTLTDDELRAEVKALIDKGHKRLVVDFGEHPDYDVDVLAHTVEIIYSVKNKNGEIRRVNMNCIPLDV